MVIKYAEFIGVTHFFVKSTVLEISACGFIGAPIVEKQYTYITTCTYN